MLLYRIAQEMDFEETVNRLLGCDPYHCAWSPGARMKALAINILYIADSALVTKRNLRYMGRLKLKFVSRLPDLFSEGETLKDFFWRTNAWQDVGALPVVVVPASPVWEDLSLRGGVFQQAR